MVEAGIGRVATACAEYICCDGRLSVGRIVETAQRTDQIIDNQIRLISASAKAAQTAPITIVGYRKSGRTGLGHAVAIKQVVLHGPGGRVACSREGNASVVKQVI